MEILSAEEVRIIGSLIEKEYSTPEYYPLTLNALTNACNQKSSRNPVVNYDEMLIELNIQKLRDKGLVAKVTGQDMRVPKYRELFGEHSNLSIPQTAVMCILFLRGPQTVGEIKSRSYRIYEFKDLAETEETLDGLINKKNDPFAVKLPKDSGRESRYTHLFCGEPVIPEKTFEPTIEDKVAMLENDVKLLKESLESLKIEVENFKKSFE